MVHGVLVLFLGFRGERIASWKSSVGGEVGLAWPFMVGRRRKWRVVVCSSVVRKDGRKAEKHRYIPSMFSKMLVRMSSFGSVMSKALWRR
jgi:hypothetical protein